AQHGIVHDTKLDNVMVDEEGHVCLVDFGLAERMAIENGEGGDDVPDTVQGVSSLLTGLIHPDAKDYVKGVEIFEMIAKQRLTLSKVKFYAAELLTAVNNLHKHGIVHRDIKNNVMVDEEGHICLIDFELATDQVSGVTGPTLTGRQQALPRHGQVWNIPSSFCGKDYGEV
ncbi:hypothetical protein BaRGS_00006877, partial [Batillaria attramentaria]